MTEAHGAAEAGARRSYGKLVALLAAGTRDVAAAEDALSEVFAAALAVWPERGRPAKGDRQRPRAARCWMPCMRRSRKAGVTPAGPMRSGAT